MNKYILYFYFIFYVRVVLSLYYTKEKKALLIEYNLWKKVLCSLA